tara:strand:+ start:1447 stop:2439 length:993 start_codon:yes stop_codon:yes gene_type:complete
MNVSEKHIVKVAVVGLGQFGLKYINSLNSIPLVDVKWVVARRLEQANQVAVDYNIKNGTDDLDHVLNDYEVDVVVVVTPEDTHREITVKALESGKHVIVEKPLATNESDAELMINAQKASGKLLMTAFLLRFDYRYSQLKLRLEELGRILNIYAWRNFDRNLFKIYSRTHSFMENAIHDIDLIQWILGDDPLLDAHGFTRNTMGFANPDINWGILEFTSGTIATIQTSWLYPVQKHSNLQWNAGMQVMAERGVLEVANDRQGFTANTEETGILLLDQTGWADLNNEPRGAFGAMLRHFIHCVRGDTTYIGTTPEEALLSIQIAKRLIENS